MWLINKPIAHRGLHDGGLCPENSLAAIRKAMRFSFPVEIDIHLTAEEQIAVFHDKDLFRMTGVKGAIRDCTGREISGYRLFGTDERIPLIDQVLNEVKGSIPILIEIKNDGPIGVLEGLLVRKLDDYQGEYAIQSFNPRVLKWFKKNRPDTLRGQISCFFEDDKIISWKKAVFRMMLLNQFTSPDFIAYDVKRLPYWAVTLFRKSGKPVLGWTVNNAELQRRAAPFIDNIIFEGYLPYSNRNHQ